MYGIASGCWPCLLWPLGPPRHGFGVAHNPVRRQRARTLRRIRLLMNRLTDRHIAGERGGGRSMNLETVVHSDALADARIRFDLELALGRWSADLELK